MNTGLTRTIRVSSFASFVSIHQMKADELADCCVVLLHQAGIAEIDPVTHSDIFT